MNFIKKIVDGVNDKGVHFQFMKFSKGTFTHRAIIKAKQVRGKYTLQTSHEFANDLVRDVAEKLGENKTKVTGAILSTNNLKDKLDFKEIKQFQGVKRYLLDKEMSGTELLQLLNEFPKAFFALSFSTEIDETVLKIKPKAPKSGKPGTKGEDAPKPDFCKLTTQDASLGGSFVFEHPTFHEAFIDHTFLIENIILPEGEKDYAKMRELAKKQGKIIRKITLDGTTSTKEIPFKV